MLLRISQIAAFYYPNPPEAEGEGAESGTEGSSEGHESTGTTGLAAKATELATEAALRFIRG